MQVNGRPPHYHSSEVGDKPPDTRKEYCRPEIQRVQLALEETLATGCKLGAEAEESCVFPIAIWDVGS